MEDRNLVAYGGWGEITKTYFTIKEVERKRLRIL